MVWLTLKVRVLYSPPTSFSNAKTSLEAVSPGLNLVFSMVAPKFTVLNSEMGTPKVIPVPSSSRL